MATPSISFNTALLKLNSTDEVAAVGNSVKSALGIVGGVSSLLCAQI